MKKKVILISIDGVRADAVLKCQNPYVAELMKKASYTLGAKTVFPSSTMPCHMSMFHSVTPEVHGTSVWYEEPQNPICGLFEHVCRNGAKCSMFFGWEPLREITRSQVMAMDACMFIESHYDFGVDSLICDYMIDYTKKRGTDFVFLYMGNPDTCGHRQGWMCDEYLGHVSASFDNVRRVAETFGDEYTIIVTTDHGGHDCCHGTLMNEDMIIPMFFLGEEFEPGKELTDVSILDIAPTVADVMGVVPAQLWTGKSLLK